ncbi:SulP family inorganic anion transporter [Herbaspirillum sp. RTI4]|uniref:SulP family inorganic anion transporter n=1 Tax=Herbaspirillum sp. RTI4 TaxID=3048640 RepID=UPI002AB38D61|nr:SulP family inorganic anion transporter [Herbaspirillum sp. RTI4]MDY7577500.1 SulP family inorganic anion transporter [Herbaspirillum sp. RTI4]MEA9980975.1 SulP family inorganic anion transporter [Herbaspirillum sp. RTI4]
MTAQIWAMARGADLLAGSIVFLIAMPLCLGIADASGVRPAAGMLSGIIGGVIVALLSGSRLTVSGPAAGLILIIVEAIARLGSFNAFLSAVVLAGIMQIGLGLLKAGQLAAYAPSSVIKGMLTGIGLLLMLKQIPLALGFPDGNWISAATSLNGHLLTSLGVTLLSLLLLFLWENATLRRSPLVRTTPAALLVVLTGILSTLILSKWAPMLALPSEHRVELPILHSFADLRSILAFPDFTRLGDPQVWLIAMSLALVASLNSLLSMEAVEQLDPHPHPTTPNRELRAQGCGNLLAGLIGGLPIGVMVVHSSTNLNTGARSKMAAVVYGLLLLISMFTLDHLLNLIPLASLAAILFHTGYKLAKPSRLLSIARQGIHSWGPFLATAGGVIALDVLSGAALGFVFCLTLTIAANLRHTFLFSHYDNQYFLLFRKDVSFLGKITLQKHLDAIPPGATLTIDADHVDFIDPDVLAVLQRFDYHAAQCAITVHFHGLRAAWQALPSPAPVVNPP